MVKVYVQSLETRYGSPWDGGRVEADRFQAYVLWVSHSPDLALLNVDTPGFFEGATPLELGEIPTLQPTPSPRARCVARRATRYDAAVIQSIQHKGLKKFFAVGSAAGIQPHHSKRLRMLLAALDTAQTIEDMNIPGLRLHPLKGSERGRWSIWVNGNWRLTFEFRDGHVHDLDYEDYH